MAGTMEGLGVPLFGGYTSYQSNGTTAFLTVNSDGTHDFTWADEGADNFISVTITDSTTITSGYIQSFYTSLSVTGAYSTGNTQINAFAADISLSGTPGVEVAGMYLYFSETGTTTVTNLNLNGVVVYLNAMGGSPMYRAGFKVYSEETNTASTLDGAFVAVSAGAGHFGSVIGYKGGTPSDYFIWIEDALSGGMMYPASDVSSISAGLKVNYAGTVYFIPLYASSCTD